MGVSRSRMQRTPPPFYAPRHSASGCVFGAVFLSPSRFLLRHRPYGAVCFVRSRAPLGNNYRGKMTGARHGWSPRNYSDYSKGGSMVESNGFPGIGFDVEFSANVESTTLLLGSQGFRGFMGILLGVLEYLKG